MSTFDAIRFGASVNTARTRLGLSQQALAQRLNSTRFRVLRLESGQYLPRLDEAIRLAEALRVPLQWLLDGRWAPSTVGTESILYEIYQMGVRDFDVAGASVPGAFRHGEEVLALAVRGDKPEPRIVESIPYILAQRRFRPALLFAFGRLYDLRVRHRIGWLADLTLSLSGTAGFPPVKWPKQLETIGKGLPALKSDSLGHPDESKLPPVWRRWNITYAGRPSDFLRRAAEIQEAGRTTPTIRDEEA